MNIPEIYLVEPYNAYAPKGRKKHWHEIIEEQNLLARILAEQQALQEAASKTLPPQAPEYSTPTIVGNSAGAGQAGQPGSAAGGGGVPVWDFWNQSNQLISFSATPTSGVAPLSVAFLDTTVGAEFDTFLWTFGDGTTSTLEDPNHVYNTGSFSSSFQITGSNGYTASTGSIIISASIPVVVSAFTLTGSTTIITAGFYTASVNDTLTFINGSTINNGTTLTYNWTFGSASLTSSATNPTFTYTTASTYTVVLGATGSYGLTNAGSRKIKIV